VMGRQALIRVGSDNKKELGKVYIKQFGLI
jgi:hypothetical protein